MPLLPKNIATISDESKQTCGNQKRKRIHYRKAKQRTRRNRASHECSRFWSTAFSAWEEIRVSITSMRKGCSGLYSPQSVVPRCTRVTAPELTSGLGLERRESLLRGKQILLVQFLGSVAIAMGIPDAVRILYILLFKDNVSALKLLPCDLERLDSS